MKTVCGEGLGGAKGIDVSLWQRTIDWPRVRRAGVSYAFVKAVEGLQIVDPMFATNWEGARKGGILRGAYAFARPGQGNPEGQADLLLRTVAAQGRGELPSVLDLEDAGGLGVAELGAWSRAFIGRLVARDRRMPIIYVSPGWWDGALGRASGVRGELWTAHWGARCPGVPDERSDWVFWQHSATGRVDGIETDVDLNVFNGGRLALRMFASGVDVKTLAGAALALGAAYGLSQMFQGGAP